jgi:membrane protein insertase Oxa1/YidC/SpoIIIJ
VLGSALIQFFQIKQTMPSDKDARKLREILKDANTGKQADNAEVSAAMGRNMAYVLPLFIFVVTIGFPAALSLYWFVGGLIAYMQQSYLLKQDEYAMTGATATVVSKKPLKAKTERSSGVKVTTSTEEASTTEVKTTKPKPKKAKSSSKSRKKKRR